MNERSFLVLVSAFSVTFLSTGGMKSLGVMLPSFKEQLEAETWIMGSLISIIYIAGCMVGKYGGNVKLCRTLSCISLTSCITVDIYSVVRGETSILNYYFFCVYA